MNLSATDLRLPADAAVDLHLHTVYSDGRWTTESLLDHLLHERFGLAAITDHDRADTVASIQRLALEKHMPMLVGVEMTAAWQGGMTDLLCFGFDPDNGALNSLAQDLLRRQQANTREAYERVRRKGCDLPPDALPALLDEPSSEQPHAFVALLKEHGYGLGEPSAGKIAWEAGVRFSTNEPAAVVEAAHQSGGVCLLAHPGREDGFVTYDARSLDQFRREAPIDGLEVYHPLHSPDRTEMYREYARRHHLLTSAGSDSHRPEKPPIKYRAGMCRGLLERLGIRIT
jgi:predicted metal-dependent phosphoesterase TrpH